MQNNIEIRNLYIGKIQKQINKLMHSVQLLNNLNNVIANQYGGSDAEKSPEKSLASAQSLLDQQNVKRGESSIARVVSAADQSNEDLKKTIEIFRKHIIDLKDKLAKATDTTDKDALQKQIDELTEKIKKLTETLEAKEKELNDIRQKTAEFEKQLEQYDEILKELKTKLPQIENTAIYSFNSAVDSLVKKLSDPDSLIKDLNEKPEKIRSKLQEKFNGVFTQDIRDKMSEVVVAARKLKIEKGPEVDGNQLGIKPFVPKNQEEENAITELVNKQNETFKNLLTTNNDLIEDINTFISEYNRAENVMNAQNLTGKLEDDFNEFNKYFSITASDLTN